MLIVKQLYMYSGLKPRALLVNVNRKKFSEVNLEVICVKIGR